MQSFQKPRSVVRVARPAISALATESKTRQARPLTPAPAKVIRQPCSPFWKAFLESKTVLIGAGAGFSADSGLKVYKDIAKVAVYSDMGLDYADLCNPALLRSRAAAEMFLGFWGSCYNDYMDTKPHEGYSILLNLLKKYNKNYFVYTSNVDHFFPPSFGPERVFEMHGTSAEWQCSKRCCSTIYCLEPSYRFPVNSETMSFKWQKLGGSIIGEQVISEFEVEKVEADSAAKPSTRSFTALPAPRRLAAKIVLNHRQLSEENIISQIRQRPHVPLAAKRDAGTPGQQAIAPKVIRRLKVMHLEPGEAPSCPNCQSLLRPRVLMFDDDAFLECEEDEARFSAFKRRMLAQKEPVLIVELGCGLRVPSIRIEFERLLRKMIREKCIRADLFRVNPGDQKLQPKTQRYEFAVHHVKQPGADFFAGLKPQLESKEQQ